MKNLKTQLSICILFFVISFFSAQAQISNDLTHEEAMEVLLAAKKKAEDQGTKMNIAVVDAGANLKAFIRMDGSYLGSIDVAIKKAKTARYFDIDTGKLGELTQPGGIIYNIEHSNGGLITFPGGVPIIDENGTVIGAIGVSGGSIDQDREAAQTGAKVILE
ncbi:heme-binding protein [uncultured Algibacter sp.]|uniref:GlcG/HbpS family heme-binding protein n=1 Tax=uncultured Algibacter sp. TaxID=298659 RepID=UPI002630514E|nr:heme-binding protein [uncultured Algibacter sp.]